MKERADALAALLETTSKAVKSLSLRNILVIALLVSIALPVYFGMWILQVENRPILLDFIGYSRVVGVTQNCPIIKMMFQGKETYAVFLPYNADKDTGTFYMASTIEKLDTKIADKSCGILNLDRQILRDFYVKKDSMPALPRLP
jgi:hypothetical protein